MGQGVAEFLLIYFVYLFLSELLLQLCKRLFLILNAIALYLLINVIINCS